MNQSNWPGLMLSLIVACLFGSLAYLSLLTVPVAANSFPNCGVGGTTPAPPTGAVVFTLTGSVADQGGSPVECVQVFAFSGATQFYTYTRSSGHYTLALSVGTYDVVFNPPAGSRLAAQSRRGTSTTQTINMTLPPGYVISGTIYSDTAKLNPVENVSIFAFNKDTFEGFGLPPSTISGMYQIALEAGPWELTFTPPPFKGLGPTQTTIILAGDITRDIILPPGFTVYGQVKDSNDNGVANVEIFAQDPRQPNGYGFAPTDQGGAFTGTLPAGTFDISFLAPPFMGLGSVVVTNVVGPPDVIQNVMLPAGYTVSGTIRCGGGLANAFVSAAPQPPALAGHFGDWGRFAGFDGFYALALQLGVYTFTVSPPGNSSLFKRIIPQVDIQQDMTLNVDYNCVFIPLITKG